MTQGHSCGFNTINFNLNTFTAPSSSGGVVVRDSVLFLQDPDFVGWEVQVTRLTPDSATTLLVNASYVDSICELYGNQVSYPNTAIVRSTFDATINWVTTPVGTSMSPN